MAGEAPDLVQLGQRDRLAGSATSPSVVAFLFRRRDERFLLTVLLIRYDVGRRRLFGDGRSYGQRYRVMPHWWRRFELGEIGLRRRVLRSARSIRSWFVILGSSSDDASNNVRELPPHTGRLDKRFGFGGCPLLFRGNLRGLSFQRLAVFIRGSCSWILCEQSRPLQLGLFRDPRFPVRRAVRLLWLGIQPTDCARARIGRIRTRSLNA